MKKLILLLAVISLYAVAQAQELKDIEIKDVPAAVTEAFSKANPGIDLPMWSKGGRNYVVAFSVKGKSNEYIWITYTATGEMVQTETDVEDVSTLPPPIAVYMKQYYKIDKIRSATKVTDAKGVVIYYEDLDTGTKELMFDPKGKFIKSVKNTH